MTNYTTLPLLIAAGVVLQASGYVATHHPTQIAEYVYFSSAHDRDATTETAVVALNPYAPPIVKSEDRVLPDIIPPEALLPVEPVPVIKKVKRHRHSHRNHDAPMKIVGVTHPVSHNEEETMHPTRAYCTRLGNPKSLAARPEVCFERDMITGKIYKIPN